MVSVPEFCFVGDPAGSLAGSVQPAVHLSPYSQSALVGCDGVLVDGAAAAGFDNEISGVANLKEILGSGTVLALANANEAQRRSLVALTGYGPTSALPLVIYRRARDGVGFACRAVSPPGTGSAVTGGETGVVTGMPGPAGLVDLGAELCRAVADALGTSAWSVPGFVPPNGAIAGYFSVSTPVAWAAPYPQNNGGIYDDNSMVKSDQSIASDVLTEFFVYWVNGTNSPTVAPYFVVIVRETGPLAVGGSDPPFNTESSRGYFQLSFSSGPATFTSANGSTLSGLDLTAYTPTTQSGGQLAVDLSVVMALVVDVQGGTGSAAVTAQVQSTSEFADWGVTDQTAGTDTEEVYHQTQPWDVTTTPAGSSVLLGALYDSGGNVVTFPDLSFGSLPIESLSAWQFGPPIPGTQPGSTAPPASYPVVYSTSWTQVVGLAHNPAGCAGAFGFAQRHNFAAQYHLAAGPWTVDLAQISALGNYPHGVTPP